MSTPFYDLASLVIQPSGVKAGKVYAQKPLTTDGQLTFTRSNDTATRVGPDGLIEKVRTNLLTYSNDFTNAAWTKNRASVSGQFLTEDTATGTHEMLQTHTISSGISYTFSISAKASTRNKIALVLAGSAFSTAGNGVVIFDLSNGIIYSTAGGATGAITSEGNGLYRCSITKLSVSSAAVVVAQLVNDAYATSYTGNGTGKAEFYYSQFEVSDFGATPYIGPTTSAAVSVGPVANVPRLDYLGSSCPRLILEPQRTNSILYSEQFDQWSEDGATVTPNATTSPDGYQNADNIVSLSGVSYGRRQTVITSIGSNTYSAYAKPNGFNYVKLVFSANASTDYVVFNLSNGTIAGGTYTNASISEASNGFYRCTITTQINVTNPILYLWLSDGTISRTSGVTGDGVKGIFAYGAQLEAGAYATSYIPTLGSASTRGSDAASKTGISSLIGQTEGTLFVDCEPFATGTTNVLFMLADGTTNNRVEFYWTGTNSGTFVCSSGGAIQFNISLTLTQAQRNKIAVVYKANDFAVYANGVSIGSSSSGSVPSSLSSIEFSEGAPYLYMGKINQTLLFKTRLSNSSLAELTSL